MPTGISHPSRTRYQLRHTPELTASSLALEVRAMPNKKPIWQGDGE